MKWIAIILLLTVISCNYKKSDCDISNYKILNLYPVNTIIKLPAYKILDSTRFDSQTVLNYRLQSTDSSIFTTAFIYNKTYDTTNNLNHVLKSQKSEVEFGRNFKKVLTEEIKQINNIKVGYLKYLIENPQDKFFEGRVFFYRGNTLTVLWFIEKYSNENKEGRSAIDCVFESIQFK